MKAIRKFSSPFIEERLYLERIKQEINPGNLFSSPFIEERLYLETTKVHDIYSKFVLVPFYRGAVVFSR